MARSANCEHKSGQSSGRILTLQICYSPTNMFTCVLTTPVCVDKINNDLAIQRPVERPNKQICQQHQKTNYQSADNEHVAEDHVKWKELYLHPPPESTHVQ